MQNPSSEKSKLVDERSWWIYIVECLDGTYYTGISPDINNRIEKHNLGTGAKYTKFRRPVTLLYYEKHKNRSGATKREIQIKKLTRDQKKELIDNFFPVD
jgi:putative endonuclease